MYFVQFPVQLTDKVFRILCAHVIEDPDQLHAIAVFIALIIDDFGNFLNQDVLYFFIGKQIMHGAID